jgi:dolichyl-phosphate-mannose--protein O-mannosyl transferase
LPRIATPSHYIFDEAFHAYTAGQYLVGDPNVFVPYTRPPVQWVEYTWNHPPAGLWVIASGIAVLGDNALGWRAPSAAFGAAGLAIAYALALALTRSRFTAVLTATLLPLTGLYFVQSRIAMLDIFGTVFMLGASLAFYRFLSGSSRSTGLPLALTGPLVGLAVATKWSAAFPAALICLAALRYSRIARRIGRGPEPRGWRATAPYADRLSIPLALVLLPLLVYLLAYTTYFASERNILDLIDL